MLRLLDRNWWAGIRPEAPSPWDEWKDGITDAKRMVEEAKLLRKRGGQAKRTLVFAGIVAVAAVSTILSVKFLSAPVVMALVLAISLGLEAVVVALFLWGMGVSVAMYRRSKGLAPGVYPGPQTYAGYGAESLVSETVSFRPYYCIPTGRGELGIARSPFTVTGRVIGALGSDMAQVRCEEYPERAPWHRNSIIPVAELHNAYSCKCSACKGYGSFETDGP